MYADIDPEGELGQGIFRVSVLDACDRACAVTGEHSLPVLEAAHIMPYADGGTHDVTNGLLLRSDIHRLFDLGYVTVTPEYRFKVSDALAEDFHNGRTYYAERDRRAAGGRRVGAVRYGVIEPAETRVRRASSTRRRRVHGIAIPDTSRGG